LEFLGGRNIKFSVFFKTWGKIKINEKLFSNLD